MFLRPFGVLLRGEDRRFGWVWSSLTIALRAVFNSGNIDKAVIDRSGPPSSQQQCPQASESGGCGDGSLVERQIVWLLPSWDACGHHAVLSAAQLVFPRVALLGVRHD